MDFDTFIKKYNGKFVEYHSYGNVAINQCIDLVNQYFVEVLGVQAVIGTDAVDVPSKVSPNDFEWVKNSATNAPVKGDVIVWSGVWGHIAICYEANSNDFVSFDQNWPTGSVCKLVGHDYTNVLGWLHPKEKPVSDALTICLQQHTELVNKCNDKDKEIEALNKTLKDLQDQIGVKTLELNAIRPKAVEWEITSKKLGVASFTDIDAIIRSYKEIIAGNSQTSNPLTQPLKECRTNLSEAKKLSVKVVSKTTLIKELLSRFTGK
jgi:hypothetical protein